jgi:hypothetical protein
MKRKYILAVPFWGDTHFRLWLQYSLPSYLSENNIPYMSKNLDFTILICTDKKTKKIFEDSDEYKSISKYCDISFLNISSIIQKYRKLSYGCVLTHSYHKVIRAYGTLAYQINFIFLNADFILADGVLKTVDRLVDEGSEIIFCPSFRVTKEQFLPNLMPYIKKQNGSEILLMNSRDLTSLAFEHIHPTIIAQTINSKEDISSLITNQFYWKTGEDIILAHHFLIFPFVIKPKKIPKSPTGYIDYNLVYDFSPKGDITYITDSDDAFIVEPESQYKEAQHLVSFKKSPKKYYDLLSQWVNRLHYNNSKQLLIFHTKNLKHYEKLLKKEKKMFNAFLQQVHQKFNSFQPFLNHPYWRNTNAYLNMRLYFSYYIKEYLKNIIKVASQIDLDKVTLLLSDKSKNCFKNNVLNINMINPSTLSILNKSIIYTDFESILICDSQKKMNMFQEKDVYVYIFTEEEFFKYKNFINNNNILVPVKNFQNHKTLISSIKIIFSIKKGILDKIFKTLKIIFICSPIKFKDPFPQFLIFKVSLPSPNFLANKSLI